MKRKICSGVALSLVLVMLLAAAYGAGTKRSIEADFLGASVTIDGVTINPADANGNPVEVFSVDGTTYLPVRAVAEAAGLDVTWNQSTLEVELTTVVLPKQEKVYVSTMEEFMEALESNTEIILTEGEFDFMDVVDYAPTAHIDWIHTGAFEQHGDAACRLRNLSNITIRGAGKDETTIVTSPDASDVLNFQNCSNITVMDVTLGHSPKGTCFGSVIGASDTTDLFVDNCGLYGCGVFGLEAFNCKSITMRNCDIYDCSYGAAYLDDCVNVAFEWCNIYENGHFDLFTFNNVHSALIQNCDINQNATAEGGALFYLTECSDIIIKDNFITNNTAGAFVGSPDNPYYRSWEEQVTYQNNYFGTLNNFGVPGEWESKS